MILVLTGPAAGNVSLMASAWKRIAASASTVEYTPHAPSHGSTRSSCLNPSTSSPRTNVSAQSLRLFISACTNPSSSLPSSSNCPASRYSAKLASNGAISISASVSSSGDIETSTPPSSSTVISVSMGPPSISISIPSPSVGRPCGIAYKLRSIAI